MDGLAPDPVRLDELPLETLIDLRRQHDHVRTELDAAITRKMAGLRAAGALADTDVLTVSRLATLWGMKVAKVRELCRTGQIPARKLGKKEWVVPAAALRGWIQENPVAEPVPGGYIRGQANGRGPADQEASKPYRVEVRRARGVPPVTARQEEGRPQAATRESLDPAARDGL